MITKAVSADSHVIEPSDLYASLRAAWGERAPVVVRADDGTDWWWVDGQRTNSFAGGSQAGKRAEGADTLLLADAVDNVRDALWSPERYVNENVTDDPEHAALELARAVGRGLAAAMLPVALPHRQTYADPRFDCVWAAAADLGVPISFHIGTYRADAAREKAVVIAGAQTDTPRPVQTAFSTADLYVRNVLADLVFAGVFERHPGLRVVSAEHEIGWLAHFVERMDYTYTQRATRGLRFRDAALPSDFVRRQVWVQFCEDPLASHAIDVIGAANVLWGTDYPHSEGTFPHSLEVVASLLHDQSEAVRRAVLVDNPVALYGIDPAVLVGPAERS